MYLFRSLMLLLKVYQIERKYSGRIRLHCEAIAKDGMSETETSIFDLLWQAKEDDRNSFGFLAFIEKTCASLLALLDRAGIAKLQKTCFQAVTNFGPSESKYLCYVGELANLERVLSKNDHHLVDVEYKMPNGKSFDFAIEIDSKLHLIEVLSIFTKSELMGDEAGFQNFIEKRYVDKLSDKTKGISNRKYTFALLPVLWGEFNKLDEYIRNFKIFSPPRNIILPPMIIPSFRNVETEDIVYTLMDVKQYHEYRATKRNQIQGNT